MLRPSGMVVRVDGVGIGVMFLEHNEATAYELRLWLEASRTEFEQVETGDGIALPELAEERAAV